MFTVVDHARPWLTPSNTLANTTQPQEGARMMSSGTGSAAVHPASNTARRPRRSASRPAVRLLAALTRPKLIRKERIAARLARWKSCSASGANVERSIPTTPPTKALIATSSTNCLQFARSPRAIACGALIRGRLSGDCAAVGSSLQLARIVGEFAALVEVDDEGVVRRVGRDMRENGFDELVGLQPHQTDGVADCPDGRRRELAVEGNGLGGVAG